MRFKDETIHIKDIHCSSNVNPRLNLPVNLLLFFLLARKREVKSYKKVQDAVFEVERLGLTYLFYYTNSFFFVNCSLVITLIY